jgi:hypothetical protein
LRRVFYLSGKLKKLHYFQEDPRIKAVKQLSNIWGVGEKTAEVLIKKGFSTIEQLRAGGKHLLTAQQLIGKWGVGSVFSGFIWLLKFYKCAHYVARSLELILVHFQV